MEQVVIHPFTHALRADVRLVGKRSADVLDAEVRRLELRYSASVHCVTRRRPSSTVFSDTAYAPSPTALRASERLGQGRHPMILPSRSL